MKNTLLLCIFIFASIVSHAQFTRGDKFLGGGFSLNGGSATSGDLKGKNFGFSISPSGGIFINEKISLGGFARYQFGKYQSSGNEYRTNSVSLGFQARRYFKINDKFFFSFDGTLSYLRSATKTVEPYASNSAQYSLGAYVSPTLTFFPSAHWAFQTTFGSIGYQYDRSLGIDQYDHTFGINVGLSSVSFGIAYYFRKESE